MEQPMITTGFRMPKEMIDWLKKVAERDDRDKSYILRGIIAREMALDKRKRK